VRAVGSPASNVTLTEVGGRFALSTIPTTCELVTTIPPSSASHPLPDPPPSSRSTLMKTVRFLTLASVSGFMFAVRASGPLGSVVTSAAVAAAWSGPTDPTCGL